MEDYGIYIMNGKNKKTLEEFIKEEIKIVTTKSGYPIVFKGKFDSVLSDIYKILKEKGKNIPSEEEFYKSLHEYAKDWPEELRERAKPILDACPKKPEGP